MRLVESINQLNPKELSYSLGGGGGGGWTW